MLRLWNPLTMPACLQLLQGLPTSASIGYIKIDAKPIKQALSTWVTKWIYLYTRYLQDKVRLLLCLIAELFIKTSFSAPLSALKAATACFAPLTCCFLMV